MKRMVFLTLAAGCAAVAWYQANASPKPLAQLLPSGALLCLEAKDFSRLVNDWDSSRVKQEWLDSVNYAMFERSNLFLKLNGVYRSYGAAAGFAPDMALLRSIAGEQSALALYDLQHVQFAYITRLPESKAAQTQLWAERRSFGTRQASGTTFYVKTSNESTVAFAVTGGYLLIASNEDRLAGMLGLLAGGNTPSIAAEGWYKQSTEAAGAAGELRLALNLEDLVESTYFRSYWVQRNVSQVRRFLSGVADIRRTAGEIEERRIFLKRVGQTDEVPSADARAAADSLRQLVPDDAGLYRVWAGPPSTDAVELLETHIFNPAPTVDSLPQFAPPADSTSVAGDEAALETRIDEPPLPAERGAGPRIGDKLLAGADILAMIHLQSSLLHASNGTVTLPCVVGLLARASWDADRVKLAIGGDWTTQQHGARAIYHATGLAQTAFAVEGALLLIADDQAALTALLDRPRTASPSHASYAAVFRHGRERANYLRLMTALDFAQSRPYQMPAFFSGNLGSLSSALRGVDRIEISEDAAADRVEQRVVYSLLQLR